uniref:Putative glutamine transport system permease protein GlnP n=1 Tax=Desulfacinum infernum TaxID=35837 RepID=A0A832A306_9BACT
MARASQQMTRGAYAFWVMVFFVFVFGVVAALYYATRKVDYVWRWYRVPQYFLYKEKAEVRSEILGRVQDIVRNGDNALIRVQGDGQTAQYTVPTKDVRVDAGDTVYPGDVLGVFVRWKVGILMQGLWLTLKVSLISILLGIVIGLIAGLARISSNPALKWSAVTYVEIIRGSPLLVQIFIWYFVLGTVINTLLAKNGMAQLPPIWYGVASLAFFCGAYVAEIVRAGIQSIHRGQMEAARSLGMSYPQAMRHVILPQALRRILPPLAGQFISLIKDSSLLGIIAIRELTKATREVVTTSLQPFELWFMCALLYLVLTFGLSMFVQYLERRTAVS